MYFDQSGLAIVDSVETPAIEPMQSEYGVSQCVLADGGERFGVCTLAFDQSEELLWMGNQGGHVTSYYRSGMEKYTSFQVHATKEIRQILTLENDLLILTPDMLKCQIRRGIPVEKYMSPNLTDMQCVLQLSQNRLLMAGHQNKMIDFNLQLWRETNLVDVGEQGCVMLRAHNRFVCAGNPYGRISFLDPNTLNVEHTLDTHSGSLSDFDVQGNLLVTCGFSSRSASPNNLSVDRFLMVYDLRMMRAVSPIPTLVDPLYLRFLPSVSSRLAVVSSMGQVQLVDTVALTEPKMCLFQVNIAPGAICLSFDISNTSQAMAFGDTAGSIHLFSSSSEPLFNNYSRETEFADSITTLPFIDIDDYNTPFSSIPLPITSPEVRLASDWPEHLIQKCYRKPKPTDPQILHTMKMQGPIGYAPNPKACKRNQVVYNLETNSDKPSNKSNQDGRSMKQANEDTGFVAIPRRYRKIDLKYTKTGNDEGQFDALNKTGLPGLEATLPNSYCNTVIQVLHYIEPLRATLLSHLCQKEFCLSCELGFLFHMLSTSQGLPCQPANFLRAFRTIPEASALGLIISELNTESKSRLDVGYLIQNWHRFILHQMHIELLDSHKKKEEPNAANSRKAFVYKETDFPMIRSEKKRTKDVSDVSKIEEMKQEEVTDITHLFGTKQLHVNTCLKCRHEVKRETSRLSCNLIYPSSSSSKDEWTFCDILLKSMCPQQVTSAWCDKCKKFSHTSQDVITQDLPKVLAINTNLNVDKNKLFWQSQMDKVVEKVINSESNSAALGVGSSILAATKPCRYGDHCSRPGCRFRHSFDACATPQPLSNNPYCSNNWLPHDINMTVTKSKLLIKKVGCNKDTSEKNADSDRDKQEQQEVIESKDYTLTAVVCFINDQSPEKKNVVALVKVPSSYEPPQKDAATGSPYESQWYLFNDFSITPIPAQEAVWFSLDWKVPCILYYSSKEVLESCSKITSGLTKDVFNQDECIARSGGSKAGVTFTPLASKEMPKPGELVAMDAEFVTLNQEESELRSDGKMSTIKPSQMSVARITCVRGQGPNEGTPFIDDYISTQEQVVDYLTKFSGIMPGDLDANFSSKHLTTLKSTYMKLRFLQDSGVIFVGHGLKTDFRVINMVVPPDQVIDTVYLFYLPHHRMVSLRFLAWHFLGITIQSQTHDSIEDSRAALQLYRKYRELEQENRVAEALSELYERGKALSWKIPDS